MILEKVGLGTFAFLRNFSTLFGTIIQPSVLKFSSPGIFSSVYIFFKLLDLSRLDRKEYS